MKTTTWVMALSVSALLAACTSAVDLDAPRSAAPGTSDRLFSHSEYRCDAGPAQVLKGQKYSESAADQARTLSGSRLVRTLRPGQVITMEYNPERINLRLDKTDVIESIGCG